MIDYLVNHALRNVWCSPDQDYQFVFQPARLTARRGASRQVDIEWQTINLPDNVNTYHVYQIGQIDPRLLGMSLKKGEWKRLSDVCMDENLLADLYTKDGRQYPRFSTYVRYMKDRNLVVAVQDQIKVGDLGLETLFLRVYSNAYFASDRSDSRVDTIVVDGLVGETEEQILLFQRRLRDRRALHGTVTCYRNGYVVDDVPPNRSEVGDVIEMVYDSTVMDVLDFPIQDLHTFNSTLDKKRKYLIRPTEKLASILYRDDVDMYLVDTNGSQYNGIYVHKNQEDALRMVTHQDYSVPVAYLAGYVNDHPVWKDMTDLTLRLYRRHSGYHRPLVFEHHRIHELYKLDPVDISDAMLGVDSTVSVWRAPALEESYYTQVMRSLRKDISPRLVQDAYGYNAMAKLLADTPQFTVEENGQQIAHLPYGLRTYSTIFEYDIRGELLGFHQHTSGEGYLARHPDCRMVEGIVGTGSEVLTTVYGEERTRIDPMHNHRMYLCDVDNYKPTWEFRDVTNQIDEAYSIVGNEVVWHVDMDRYYPAIKNDRDFLAYTYRVPVENGIIRFSIGAKEQRGDSFDMLPLSIPVGRLELWLNDRPLIENLDYFVSWPEVVICNKEFLVDGEQEITVRGTGFCLPDMSREPAPDVGFVDRGMLSRNERFNVRDDRVMRIVVDGAVYHRDQLYFGEEHDRIMIEDDVRNGAPYVIRDVVVPLRGITEEKTYALRERSRTIDREVEDYLTLKYPEAEIENPNIIPEFYQIFSPFISKIHHDLIEGIFNPPGIDDQYSEMDMREWVKDYEYLLDFEPSLKGVDRRYVSIHPHNQYVETELTVYQYTFLERLIRAYLDNAVDLTAFVRIKEGWV